MQNLKKLLNRVIFNLYFNKYKMFIDTPHVINIISIIKELKVFLVV